MEHASPQFTPLHPFGIEARDLDLSDTLDQATFEQVDHAFNHAGVAVFRDQNLAPEVQIAFSQRFGALEVHVRQEHALPGYPQVHLDSNIREGGRNIGSAYAGDNWHTDLCFMREPARLSTLHAREVPHDDTGRPLGSTLFANVADAWDRLDAWTPIATDPDRHIPVSEFDRRCGSAPGRYGHCRVGTDGSVRLDARGETSFR